MGGNAFPIPAKRLSTPQLDLLKTHASKALSPFFSRVEPLRDARDKKDHGDLDLICGWDHERAWNWKGEERGVMGGDTVSDNGMGGIVKLVSETEAKEALKGIENKHIVGGEFDGEEKERLELRLRCFDLARAVKAKEWVRRGPEISFAIPCSVFGQGAQEHQGDPSAFYQLDIPLIPTSSVDFFLISVSYSTTFLILARALRCISSSITLQMIGLLIRHPAYFGIPGIDLRLTTSADELCEYLGLDRSRWEEGFDTELDCWKWLATVKEGGKLEGAYKKMVRPRAVRQKGHKNKAGGLDAFVAFLRSTRHGEGWDVGVVEERSETPSQLIVSETIPPLSPSTMTTMSTSPPVTPNSVILPQQPEILDPDHPTPLDSRAIEALERWGKTEAYEALLKDRKAEAVIMAERQRKRVESKMRALEVARRKAEEEELESRMTSKLAAMDI